MSVVFGLAAADGSGLVSGQTVAGLLSMPAIPALFPASILRAAGVFAVADRRGD